MRGLPDRGRYIGARHREVFGSRTIRRRADARDRCASTVSTRTAGRVLAAARSRASLTNGRPYAVWSDKSSRLGRERRVERESATAPDGGAGPSRCGGEAIERPSAISGRRRSGARARSRSRCARGRRLAAAASPAIAARCWRRALRAAPLAGGRTCEPAYRRSLRVSSVRYSLLGLAAVAVLIAAMSQMASVIVDEWSQRDVELRARLVFRSIHERVMAGLAAKAAGADLKPFFEQLVEDERLQALAFCDPDGAHALRDEGHAELDPLSEAAAAQSRHVQCPARRGAADGGRALSARGERGRRARCSSCTISRSSSGGRTRPNSIWRSRSLASPPGSGFWRRRSCSRC